MRHAPYALALAALASPLAPASARADRALDSLEDVHDACAEASVAGRRELYRIDVRGWRWGVLDEEGFFAIDSRRSLGALAGRVELYASRLEPMGLEVDDARAAELEAARERGAVLRIGFFLGFDDASRTACLVRSRHAVTTVRIDVAYLEVVGEDGTVVARQETDRYTAWRDDAEAVLGAGARATVGDAQPALAPSASHALAEAIAGPLGAALARCHEEGVARGAPRRAHVLLRLVTDATGRVTESAPALSDLGDEVETACIVAAFGAVTIPGSARELRLPVRLAH